MKKGITFLFLALFTCGCHHQSKLPELGSGDITKVIDQITITMVHDVTNPPLAARFFAYACLAGYEVVAENDKNYKSMHGLVNGYPDIKKPAFANGYDYRLSALLAMLATAGKMQPSGKRHAAFEEQLLDSCRKIGFSDEVIDSSKHYAMAISKKILAYAKADKYNRISNYIRYTPAGKDSTWDPTPPSYMPPVEPYFTTIRSFTLDTATQFKPRPPVPFSADKQSAFYKLVQESYQGCGKALTQEQRNTANFWDCNPFNVQNNGHMLLGLKKISPGAHWMGITGIVCAQTQTPFAKAMQIHTIVAMGLMDSFICCWGEKYRSNRIRPETAIRRYIDPNWQPLLQTPPFPEYLSGHSCVSATSAVILSHFFGDSFHYTDNVEAHFGIPPRSFNSFTEAAKQAAISRFWGGIHFKDAIYTGLDQGTKVGNWVLARLQLPAK